MPTSAVYPRTATGSNEVKRTSLTRPLPSSARIWSQQSRLTPLASHMHIRRAARLTDGPITPYSHLRPGTPTKPQKASPEVMPMSIERPIALRASWSACAVRSPRCGLSSKVACVCPNVQISTTPLSS